MANPSSTNRPGIIRKRIVAKGASLEVYVNGTLVNKGSNASTSEGAICLQSETPTSNSATSASRNRIGAWIYEKAPLGGGASGLGIRGFSGAGGSRRFGAGLRLHADADRRHAGRRCAAVAFCAAAQAAAPGAALPVPWCI
jgi:hypothetical protein